MSVSPRLLLDFATSLDPNQSECCTRAIVSRAYYAALHAARETLPERDRPPPNEPRCHARTIEAFELIGKRAGNGREEARLALRSLLALRKKRNSADYDLSIDFGRDIAEFSLLKSEEVLRGCATVIKRRAGAPER